MLENFCLDIISFVIIEEIDKKRKNIRGGHSVGIEPTELNFSVFGFHLVVASNQLTMFQINFGSRFESALLNLSFLSFSF